MTCNLLTVTIRPRRPRVHRGQIESHNMLTAEIKGGKLLITIDVSDPPMPSATGKTLIVATSHGNQVTTATVNGRPVTIGLNAYIKPV